jgi:hypothetical protein
MKDKQDQMQVPQRDFALEARIGTLINQRNAALDAIVVQSGEIANLQQTLAEVRTELAALQVCPVTPPTLHLVGGDPYPEIQ